MRPRLTVLTATLLLACPLAAGLRIAGVDFVPKDVIFGAADPKSRAMADGPLPDECKWEFLSETRIGKKDEAQGCIRFYSRTSVTLVQTCPAPNDKSVIHTGERITSAAPVCPDANGRVAPPVTETKALSSGKTAEGKQQEIVLHPDGTRIILQYDRTAVSALAIYPDGTVDSLHIP